MDKDDPIEVEASRREFEITSISMGAIKYDRPELLFEYLKLMMGKRFVTGQWISPIKSEPDPRYAGSRIPREEIVSPDGIYTSIIIPQYHKGKFVYYIDAEAFDKIREKLEPLIKEAFGVNNEAIVKAREKSEGLVKTGNP